MPGAKATGFGARTLANSSRLFAVPGRDHHQAPTATPATMNSASPAIDDLRRPIMHFSEAASELQFLPPLACRFRCDYARERLSSADVRRVGKAVRNTKW